MEDGILYYAGERNEYIDVINLHRWVFGYLKKHPELLKPNAKKELGDILFAMPQKYWKSEMKKRGYNVSTGSDGAFLISGAVVNDVIGGCTGDS